MIEAIDVVQTAAQYVEETVGKEKFRYVSSVVATCKMLALEMEAQPETPGDDATATTAAATVDMDALVLAAYLHDISSVEKSIQDHLHASTEIAVEFLRDIDVPEERITRVEQAILAHTTPSQAVQPAETSIEGRILYDADQLGRLSGLAVVTSLIEFGERYPNRSINGDMLAAILRHIEERFVDLYQSLHTAPARAMARAKFGNTLAFLDGVIEHLSEATPV